MPKARKFTPPALYPIIDTDVCQRSGWAPRDLARAYLSGGARMLQLRAKHLASGAFLDLATGMAEDTRSAGAILIVNDRADLAVLAGADGVHVGQDDLMPEDVRRVIGADAVVGCSTHTETQIGDALQAPISYLAIGPVFATATKDTGYESVGYAAVGRAAVRASATSVPVVGIGGITLETAARVIEAGAMSVAIITDLLVGDPEARVRRYLAALG